MYFLAPRLSCKLPNTWGTTPEERAVSKFQFRADKRHKSDYVKCFIKGLERERRRTKRSFCGEEREHCQVVITLEIEPGFNDRGKIQCVQRTLCTMYGTL